MRKYYLFPVLLIFIVFTFYNCEQLTYSPTGSNFVVVEEPSSNVTLSLTDIQDTAFVWGNVKLICDIEIKSIYDIHDTQFYIDSTYIGKVNYDGTMSFDSKLFKDGIYELTVFVASYPENKSLAAQMRLEVVTTLKTFSMVITNDKPPLPVEITEVSSQNGVHKIKWNKYKYGSFGHYEIGYIDSSGISPTKRKFASIYDIDSLEYINHSYLGGRITYVITVWTNTVNPLIESEYYTYEEGASEILDWTITDETEIRITWQKCKYESSFEYYHLLYTLNDNPSNYHSAGTFHDIDDTSSIIDFRGFGVKRNYFVITHGIGGLAKSKQIEIYRGSPFPNFVDMQFIPSTKYLYLHRANGTLRLDYITHEVLAETEKKVIISHDGTRAYSLQNGNMIEELNPLSFEVNRIIYVDNILQGSYFVHNIYVGEPNILYINRERIYYIDVDEMKIIGQLPSEFAPNNYPRIVETSPHGYLYLTEENRLISVDASNYEISAEGLDNKSARQTCFSYEDEYDLFIEVKDNDIIISKYLGQDIISTSRFTTDNKMDLPSKDPLSNLVGAERYYNQRYYIFDVVSQSLVKDFEAPAYGERSYFLFNSKIYSTDGLYIGINNL